MPLVTVSKEYRFEAAHFLPRHFGKCQRLHGHSYMVELHVTGEVDREGMVVDFYHLSAAADYLLGHWDHKLLVHYTAEDVERITVEQWETLNQIGIQGPENLVCLGYYTTAENMAMHIAQQLAHYFRINYPQLKLRGVSVDVHETSKTNASYAYEIPR